MTSAEAPPSHCPQLLPSILRSDMCMAGSVVSLNHESGWVIQPEMGQEPRQAHSRVSAVKHYTVWADTAALNWFCHSLQLGHSCSPSHMARACCSVLCPWQAGYITRGDVKPFWHCVDPCHIPRPLSSIANPTCFMENTIITYMRMLPTVNKRKENN